VAFAALALSPHEPAPAVRERIAEASGATELGASTACVTCHDDVAREWAASRHRTSFTDASFQKGFAREPEPYCRDCHAPERARETAAVASDVGVACVTCHAATAEASHGEGARAAEARCATCHEFPFPRGSANDRAELMQRTVREHVESDHRDTSCAACHLPASPSGRRSHAFDVTRNAPLLRAALDASASRPEPTLLEVSLAPRGVGHAFPTGDMFRRLVVRAETLARDGRVVATREETLSRSFTFAGQQKRELADTRLVGPRAVRVFLGAGGAGRDVRWRVVYQRVTAAPLVAPPIRGAAGADGHVEDEIVLAEGLAPARAAVTLAAGSPGAP